MRTRAILFLIFAAFLFFAACSTNSSKNDSDKISVESDLLSDTSVETDGDEPAVTDDDVKNEGSLTDDKGVSKDGDTVKPDNDEEITDISTDETPDEITDEINDETVDESTDETADAITDIEFGDIDIVLTGGIFFSEYIHGSGNTKALEIYNASGYSVPLGNCVISVYKDGNSAAEAPISLGSIDLANGSAYTICHTNFPDKTHCDQLVNPGFNGNDAIELSCLANTLDVIGQIGFDPGDTIGWGTDGVTTYHHTLKRKCGVLYGDANGADAFDPAAQWDGYAVDTIDGLGSHITTCPIENDDDTVSDDQDTTVTVDTDVTVVDEDTIDVSAIDTDVTVVDEDTIDVNTIDTDVTVIDEDTIDVDTIDVDTVDNDIAVPDEDATPVSGSLFFSEYIHGSGNTKALEIYNASGYALSLNVCAVNVYKDGGTAPETTINLGSLDLASGSAYTICHTNFPDKTNCDQLVNPGFNGNDAIELSCLGNTLDVIGQIGVNPGNSGWGTGNVTTYLHTLKRKCGILFGDTNGADAFDPAVQWDGYAVDTIDGLGLHTATCPIENDDDIIPEQDTVADTDVTVIDEDTVDEDTVDIDTVDEDTVDVDSVDEDTTDEDTVDEDAVDLDTPDEDIPAFYPQISVKQGETALMNDGDPFDLGAVNIESEGQWTEFTIYNSGEANLNLSDIWLSDLSNYSIYLEETSLTVAPGSWTSFWVELYPSSAGELDAHVTITSDDPAADYYIVNITGKGVEDGSPAINVYEGETEYESKGEAYNFGKALTGDSLKAKFLVYNSGSTNLIISNTSIISDDFSYIGPEVFSLNPGKGINIGFLFTPTTAGGLDSTFILYSNDPVIGNFELNLAGTGVAKKSKITIIQGDTEYSSGGEPFNFGEAVENYGEVTRDFTIRNDGNTDLVLDGFETDDYTNYYYDASSINNVIAPGDYTTFSVTFSPADSGDMPNIFYIYSNDPDTGEFDLNLVGTGIAGAARISVFQNDTEFFNNSDPFQFGEVAANSGYITREFFIRNDGNIDLEIDYFELDSSTDFYYDNSSTNYTVAPGEFTTVSITFQPTAEGELNDTLNIYSNARKMSEFNLNLTGTGYINKPGITISIGESVYSNNGEPYDFGNVLLHTKAVTPGALITLTNSGNEVLEISDIVLNDTENYTLDTSETALTLNPGNSTTFYVTFMPASGGIKSSNITISSNADTDSEFQLNITGRAITVLAPTLLDNYDGTGGLTYSTDGTWIENLGRYEGRASSLTTPEHSYASYDLSSSLADYTLNKTNNNAWFGWMSINRNNGIEGWATAGYSIGMVLAANSADFNDSETSGYAIGFKDSPDDLVLFKFSAGIKDGATTLPAGSTEILDSGYVCANADGGVNFFVEQLTDGRWKIYYKKGAALTDSDAANKANYTDGSVTSEAADETYSGTGYKYAGWIYAHSTSSNHAALFDNFGAGMTLQ